MLNIPSELKNILEKLIENGARPILVGGFVRDHFLDIPSKDIDIEVYSLDTLEQLSSILEEFGTLSFVGKSFGVLKLKVGVKEYDFSFPRRENKVSAGHTGFDVKVDGSMGYIEGARRRDFTINSIGFDYKEKKFLDPFKGIDDLEQKRLKHIDKKTFIEDPLRVYRGVQFCARFELSLDITTKELFKIMVKEKEFETLPKERVFEEYKKLLLKAKKPSIGLKLLNELGIEDIKKEILIHIDNMALLLEKEVKENLVLMFYYLDVILRKISNDIKLIKEIEELKQFKIPKIYEGKISKNDSAEQRVKKSYILMKNMPEPIINGRDLIELGMEPGRDFKEILEKLYLGQLNGDIRLKKDAKRFLKSLLLSKNQYNNI